MRAVQRRINVDYAPSGIRWETPMAKLCPIDGCKAKHGLCIHDKMMIAMALMGSMAAFAHWGLRLF